MSFGIQNAEGPREEREKTRVRVHVFLSVGPHARVRPERIAGERKGER